jgi:hypothetical protein
MTAADQIIQNLKKSACQGRPSTYGTEGGEQALSAVTGSGGRLYFGMVADFKSERWPE